jgi:hypothetical protein
MILHAGARVAHFKFRDDSAGKVFGNASELDQRSVSDCCGSIMKITPETPWFSSRRRNPRANEPMNARTQFCNSGQPFREAACCLGGNQNRSPHVELCSVTRSRFDERR